MIKVEVLTEEGTWQNVEYTYWKFPVGEVGVKITKGVTNTNQVKYTWIFENNEELFILLNLNDALEECLQKSPESTLYLPYLPYSRQDRVCHEGESLALYVFYKMIKDIFFNVYTDDVHNEKALQDMRMIQITNRPQHELAANLKGYDWFIAPDAGAAKKIMLHPEVVAGNTQVYIMTKSRVDGKVIHDPIIDGVTISGKVCVVDDLCDKGQTFVSVSQIVGKALLDITQFDLYVTHGFFTGGIGFVSPFYDTIYTYRTYNQEAKPFVKEFCNEV